MKYDRPVWQLMHACADALPEAFRLEDVRSWFFENYPEVGDATIRAHVVGLTEGGAKHPQFQRRSPLFRRVSRGVYAPIPFDERGELPEDNPDDEAVAPIRFRLVGPPDGDAAEPVMSVPVMTEPAMTEDDENDVDRRIRADLREDEGDDDEDDIDRRIRGDLSQQDDSEQGEAQQADSPEDSHQDDQHDENFWPFPVEEQPLSDPVTQADAARRKSREKDERRRRKAAKREAKHRAELAELDVQQARRALVAPPSLQFDPEFARTGRTEQPVVGARAIEAERARQMAARAEAVQRESVAELEQARRAAQASLETERGRLAVEREEMARIADERAELARTAHEQIEAERGRLEAERIEAEQLIAEKESAARAEADRDAAAQAEAARVEVQRAEADRLAAERLAAGQHAARVAKEKSAAEAEAVVRGETNRAAAARAEMTRLHAERVEVEREAEQEKKRVNKLRKAARKERERAEMLEREEIERSERRDAERQARESAEQHLREEADRRRREDEERQQTEQSVRDEQARLEHEALARIETERAMQDRAEAERDRSAFEQAERNRVAFEDNTAEREERERDQLEREEQQLHMTLRPMVDDAPPPAAPLAPAAPAAPADAENDGPGEPVDPFDFETREASGPELHEDRFSSPGGIVIVRAPRGHSEHVDDAGDAREISTNIAEHDAVESIDEPSPVFDTDEAAGRPSDAIVLGSVGQRLAVPAPARDAFRDLAFQRARRDAEQSGSRWFVLSAEHGLLEPQEWMSPDERAMTDIEPRHRAAWATWVVARLETLVGELPGQLVQVEAPGSIAEPVVAALRAAGAETSEGPIAQAAFTDDEQPDDLGYDEEPVNVEQEQEQEQEQEPDLAEKQQARTVDERPDAQVIPFVRAASVSEHLVDSGQTMSTQSAASLPHLPGLYAWSVDHAGSRDLNRALRLPVRAGIVYVGQTGGSSGLSDSRFSINDHVTRVQLRGRARASTFRMTLATSLAKYLGLHSIDDPRLTQWMLEHLSIATWPTEDVAGLQQLKSAVVDELAPVLNVDRRHSGEYRERFAELSGRLA